MLVKFTTVVAFDGEVTVTAVVEVLEALVLAPKVVLAAIVVLVTLALNLDFTTTSGPFNDPGVTFLCSLFPGNLPSFFLKGNPQALTSFKVSQSLYNTLKKFPLGLPGHSP